MPADRAPRDPEARLPLHVSADGVVRGRLNAAYLICPDCHRSILWEIDARGNWVERTCPLCGHHTDRPGSILDSANLWKIGAIPAQRTEAAASVVS